MLASLVQICRSPRRVSTRSSASFILLKESSALFFCLPALQLCVWSGECDVPGAALRPWVMEQGAICLSGRPSVRILQPYQCVSPANEKLAGTPAAALKMDDFPAQRRLPRTLGSTITLPLCLFCFLTLSATR